MQNITEEWYSGLYSWSSKGWLEGILRTDKYV